LVLPQIKSFIQNVFFPIGAFCLAVVLWIFVISGEQYTTILELPIEARNLNVQKTYLEEVPQYASVMLKGKGRDLFKAYLLRNYSDSKLVLDLEGISKEYEFVLNQYFEDNPKKIVLPPSYNLSFVEIVYPNRIKISLDEIMTKTIPVISKLHLTLLDGYTSVNSIQLTPDSVVIVGPKAELADIEYINTLPDTMENLSNSIKGDISLSSLGRLIEFSENSINYFSDIQQISERIIADIPVKVINKVKGIRVFPSPQSVSLTVIGGANQIAKINPDDILVSVDFNSWSIDQSFYEPNISFPINVLDWRDVSPKMIELGVARESK